MSLLNEALGCSVQWTKMDKKGRLQLEHLVGEGRVSRPGYYECPQMPSKLALELISWNKRERGREGSRMQQVETHRELPKLPSKGTCS